LRELQVELGAMIPDDLAGLDADQMLDIAARLEFYMLDPIFGELLDLTGPGAAAMHREAYARHVMRLVRAIEEHHSRSSLAYFLARVLERSFSNQQRLATLATHDQLTALYNRRGFYAYLNQWASWASRYGHSLAVAIVDIDRFKNVNDTLGHPGGDAALVAIADALGDAVRGSDIVGRSGGDEFAVLAPETGAEELVVLMNRIVELARHSGFEYDGRAIPITVSVGGAFVTDGAPVTPEQLLAAADLSLYEAKNSGRDRAGSPIVASST
jgi:diguanylate cyclase (GGDEF)-like protein